MAKSEAVQKLAIEDLKDAMGELEKASRNIGDDEFDFEMFRLRLSKVSDAANRYYWVL